MTNEAQRSEEYGSTDLFGAPAQELMFRGAYISDCGRYRYSLWRQWAPGPQVMFVGLNPSTADATLDDPTIRRCIGFARAWGYCGLIMTNLFAWRSTDPRDMMGADDAIGPDNDRILQLASARAALSIAAWGAHGTHKGRDAAVREMLPRLHYLRMTKDGHPGHPLYLPKTLTPVEWVAPNTISRHTPSHARTEQHAEHAPPYDEGLPKKTLSS